MRSLQRTIPAALLFGAVALAPSVAGAQEAPAPDGHVLICRDVNIANSFGNIGVDATDERDCRVALEMARETTRILGNLFSLSNG